MGVSAKASVTFTAFNAQQVPEATRPRWIVLGRSNVGKSSFLNTFTHPHKLFRTGSKPGVTRGAIGVNLRLGNDERSEVEIVDMPGWGYAHGADFDRKQWAQIAEKLITDQSGWPRWWVLLVDPKRKMEAEEKELLHWLGMEPLLFLWSKCDRFSKNERVKLTKDNAWKTAIDLSVQKPIWVSSKKGTGLNEVQSAMKNFVATAQDEWE